ncbi:MAG TPA: hypothetical protein VF950_24960 [Planctomycetota bacterium]
MSILLALLLQAVDQKAIDEAVAKGIAWLKTSGSPAFAKPEDGWHVPDSDELILWTFTHAGVPESDPKFKEYFQKMVEAPLGRTYKAALQAMILEEVDRKTWQKRISHCAHFLVDNQCRNGQWGYGEPVAAPPPSTPSGGPAVRSVGGKEGGPRVKPAVSKRLNVTQTRFTGESGDNSNSQYAALGLRACQEAGINVPKNVINLARTWWVSTAVKDGDKDAVASGVGGVPQGWGYRINDGAEPYGSMTAGAVGAVAIYDHLLDKDFRKDPVVQGGLAWLAKNYSVENNPGAKVHFGDGGPKAARYYYLYALERAGILTGNPLLGNKDWYLDGARVLLAAQDKNGSWNKDSSGENAVWQTCFAILFLKKATQPLIASVDR